MYISKGKIAIIIISILVIWFLGLNIGWYMYQNSKYTPYTIKCKETSSSTWLVPDYAKKDSEGYTYTVKFPNYLSLVGNLGVVLPMENDDTYVDTLIIWPHFNGEYSYAVMLYEETDEVENSLINYEVLIDENGNALEDDEDIHDILNRHRENITSLLEHAKDFWPQLVK